MRSLVWLGAIVVALSGAAHVHDAEALFLKKTLNKAKKVANDAGDKIKGGAKKAVDTVKGGVNAAVGGAKKLFEKAKAGVVNLASKVKVKASELMSKIVQKGQHLFLEIMPGQHRRLHKNLLRRFGLGGGAAGTEGSAFAVVGKAGGTLDPEGEAANPPVPVAMQKFADWYNYKDGNTQPSKSASRKSKQSLVKDQSTRGTCVAFATIAALEAQAGKLLSQEYLYWLLKDKDKAKICNKDDDGIPILDAPAKIENVGVPEEVHYLYLPWRGFDFAKMCPAGPSALAKKVANYKPKKIYSFAYRASGKGATVANPRFIEAAIDAGFDLVASFDVAFMQKNMAAGGLFYDATVDPSTGKSTEAPGGHAMLIVGYDRTGNDKHGGGHVIVKNSWGALWEDGGYVKLSYDYVRQYAGRAFIIDGVSK